MAVNKLSPIYSLIHFIGLAVSGRLHFPRQRVGQELWLDGEKWVIFRQAVVDPGKGQPFKPGAVFRPRFHVAGTSVRRNIRFSLIPIPFYVGMPGFRSKLWLAQPESGDFSGYYEWGTLEQAENYSHPLAAGFMTRRSVPGSVSFRVIPQT